MNKVNPVKELISGKITKNDIGKTVYISNSKIECQEWVIADVNHDNTTGTVDLFTRYTFDGTYYCFGGRCISYNINIGDRYYKNTYMRVYLNNVVYNGFTDDIKNAISIQSLKSNGATIWDKVKCPSLTELGCNKNSSYGNYVAGGYNVSYIEGTIYPIFGNTQQTSNNLAIVKNIRGYARDYWTRSYAYSLTADSDYASVTCCISSYGGYNTSYTQKGQDKFCDSVACIRFSSKIDPIIQELSKPNPVSILTSGRITKDYIGFPVTLTNTATKCQEWIIADINHDNTSGTVDLFPKYILDGTGVSFNYNENRNSNYRDSTLRAWLNDTIYKGFTSEVQAAIKTQSFDTSSSTISDKMKIPSLTEVGCNTGDDTDGSSIRDFVSGSTIYPIFGNKYTSNPLAIYRNTDNETLDPLEPGVFNTIRWQASYWTRSQCYNGVGTVYCIQPSGQPRSVVYTSDSSIDCICCIRF